MTKGFLVSFEGPDGAGKTTVLQHVLPILEGYFQGEVVSTREPGGITIAEKIREVILDVTHTSMDDKTELLLYIAARRQHMVERVKPALDRGSLVLVDRFIDSSVAYQGFGRGLDVAEINWLNAYATDSLFPNLTIYLDIPSEIGLERISQNSDREVNRLDLEALELHQKVRRGYLNLAQENPDRIVLIDANQGLEEVVDQVFEIISKKLEIEE